eukprot:gene31660-24590_t
MSSLRDTLRSMAAGNGCSPDAARAAMKDIMSDAAPPSQVAAFLTLLGPTRDAAVVSACADPTADIVGTGGDGADTFNVSTTGGLLMAACGVTVAK